VDVPSSASSGRAPTPAELAKATLRRLAERRLEPTPENYARAWADEGGGEPVAGAAAAPASVVATPAAAADAKAQGPAWAALIERLARNLDRGGRQWTSARRKDSLQRVLAGSRSDAERLLQRLQSLVQAWEADRAEAGGETTDVAADAAAETSAMATPADGAGGGAGGGAATRWPRAGTALAGTARAALPADDERAATLAARLATLAERLPEEGATEPLVREVEDACAQATRWLGHRHVVVAELQALCRELTAGLVELAEDDSWTRGQCAGVQARLDGGISLRALRAAGQMLAETRAEQGRVRAERNAAREALRQLLARMVDEVGELGAHAGVFELAVERHAEAVAKADSVESLAGVVQAMLEDSRQVRSAVSGAQQRLQEQQQRAHELEDRVRALEAELRRVSDEAATDALTQVSNRRGLEQAFESEAARCLRSVGAAGALAVGLIDIDNFKKLNDRLGHGAGDQALKSLAAGVRERLRPVDHIARFGGEEFVLLLPGTELDAAQQALTRLQRSLSAALFLHEGEEVFVTFSAGVTLWREGEALEATLARADEALYEAKRTGKNRTCVA
jgi:diguanylate cyclase